MKTIQATKRLALEMLGPGMQFGPVVESIAQAIAQLLHPHAEIVLHDLATLQIADYLKRHNLAMPALDQAGRVALIAHLDASGAFQTRKAVDHIAAALDLSRTTVYVLLREARQMAAPKKRSRR